MPLLHKDFVFFEKIYILENLLAFYSLMELPAALDRLECTPQKS